MAQNRPCDVSPRSEQDKYSIALMNQAGEWVGLDVPLAQIFPDTVNPPAPVERIIMNSYHGGRGADRFIPNQYSFYDSYNGWSTTPGKYHATILQRWARGLRNADFNMPDTRGVVWKPLVGNTRYLDAYFNASATYTGTRLVFLLRRKVPAGAKNTPGTLTIEFCNDSSGNPGFVQVTKTVTHSQVDDTTSTYILSDVSFLVINSGAKFHVKFYGAAGDKESACWEIGCDPGTAGLRSSNGTSWTATTFAPYFRVTDADPQLLYRPFIFDGALYLVSTSTVGAASKLWINGNRGRANGTQTSTTLQDANGGVFGGSMPTDRFKDAFIRIIRGTGQGQVRRITTNNASTYTVTPAWGITPVHADSEYVVYASDWFTELTGTGFNTVTQEPIIQNGIAYFPQGDGVAIRKMRINHGTANRHEFASETASKNNKAYFLEAGFDTAKSEPNLWRANQNATSGSTPNAKAISVSRASTAPNRVPLAFGTDLTFGESVLTGENTNRITNLHFHEGVLYVMKEDGLYLIQNDQAVQVRLGVETAPEWDNGLAAVTAGDKNLYMSFRNDVYLITGGGAYSTGLKHNLPSTQSGYISDLIAAEGWVFAAISAGSNFSSIMKFSLDTKTWSEHVRAYARGQRIRALQWQPCPETRPRLWCEIEGDMMFQEFPIDGVRPYDDKGIKYQHETVLTLPTIDLGTTDPKYFAVLNITSQGLAQETDTESQHMIVVECQTDNDIGTANWEHVDYLKHSPTDSVSIGRGKKRMIRIRLRLISNEPTDPVIVETISLSLFTRSRLAHEWQMQFPIVPDDDEQNSVDVLMWLRNAARTAEPLRMLSRFTLFHDRVVTLADEPRYQLSELDAENSEMEAQIWMKLSEVI